MVFAIFKRKEEKKIEGPVKKTRRGVFSFLYGFRESKLVHLCPCGMTHEQKLTNKDKDLPLYDDLRIKNEAYQWTCSCGNDDFVNVNKTHISFIHLRNKREKIQLSIGAFQYQVITKTRFPNGTSEIWNSYCVPVHDPSLGATTTYSIQAIPCDFVISTSKVTRNSYLVDRSRNSVRNISFYGVFGRKVVEIIHSTPELRRLLEEYVELLKEFVPTYAIEEWMENRKSPYSTGVFTTFCDLRILMALYRYPHLQMLGQAIFLKFNHATEREQLKQVSGKLALYRIKIPALTKMTLKKIEAKPFLLEYMDIMSMFSNKARLNTYIDYLEKKIHGYHGENSYSSIYTAALKKRFIKRYFQTDEKFEVRFLSKNLDRLGQNQMELSDSLLMYENIEQYFRKTPKDKWTFTKEEAYAYIPKESITELHDRLTRLANRINHVNSIIEYSKRELTYWNSEEAGVRFELAESSSQLVDIGNALSICVGSYGDRAVKKEIRIVTGYVEDRPVICLEFKGKELVQAKKKYNGIVNANDTQLVAALTAYLKKDGIKINTGDLREMDRRPAQQQLPVGGAVYPGANYAQAQPDYRPVMGPAPALPAGVQQAPPYYHVPAPYEVAEDDLPF